MLLQLVQNPEGRSVQQVAIDSMTRAGFIAVEGQRTTISGLDAFIGVYRGEIEGLGDVAMRAAHIAHDGRIYLVGGLVPPQAFGQADRTFTGSIRSFRALSASEAENIRPHRIALYTVRAGDTWESLAARSNGAVNPATLAVMNNAAPGSRPQQGARIKIVVGG
jgi:predicted Zn-dependent protease